MNALTLLLLKHDLYFFCQRHLNHNRRNAAKEYNVTKGNLLKKHPFAPICFYATGKTDSLYSFRGLRNMSQIIRDLEIYTLNHKGTPSRVLLLTTDGYIDLLSGETISELT